LHHQKYPTCNAFRERRLGWCIAIRMNSRVIKRKGTNASSEIPVMQCVRRARCITIKAKGYWCIIRNMHRVMHSVSADPCSIVCFWWVSWHLCLSDLEVLTTIQSTVSEWNTVWLVSSFSKWKANAYLPTHWKIKINGMPQPAVMYGGRWTEWHSSRAFGSKQIARIKRRNLNIVWCNKWSRAHQRAQLCVMQQHAQGGMQYVTWISLGNASNLL
jgi:hypothetical protein